jgi:pyruvate formate lyase activating enzyme
MTDHDFTSVKTLLRAAEIGKKAGLRYIYPGNIPGKVGDGENTYCPDCRTLLITRFGFQVLEDKLTATGGKCFKCAKQIPGFWKTINNRRSSQNFVEPLL